MHQTHTDYSLYISRIFSMNLNTNQKFHIACANGKLNDVKELLNQKAEIYYQNEDGISGLMLAASGGYNDVIQFLIDSGAPWNQLDKYNKCAGDYAVLHHHQSTIDLLVNAGVKAELLLGTISRNKNKDNISNSSYLNRNVVYDDEKLVDEENRGVMMQWEQPLMEAHAKILCERTNNGDILNIGYGMGLIDNAIQSYNPKSHTIIEAHPLVYQQMLRDGWDKKENVIILHGRWQDIIKDIIKNNTKYDGIFFDTFGEYYEDMQEFQAYLSQILRINGIYSFFNGLCPTNMFFHGVVCEVVRLELEQIGINSEFIEVNIEVDDKLWEEVKLKYWHWKTYYLPICTYTSPKLINK